MTDLNLGTYVTLADLVLAVYHFTSQARGGDKIPQSIIVKVILSIGHYLVEIINFSLEQGLFPTA